MGDSFVDVTYRGLEVGRRVRIRDFTSDGAYVEVPMPMPVGTSLDIAIDAGSIVKAIVARVHEQTGGSDRPPGMNVRAMLVAGDDRARAWWDARVADTPAPAPAPAPAPVPVPVPVAASADRTAPASPESGPVVIDDAARTAVMPVIDPATLDADAAPEIVDDGKRTQMMSTVEIEEIMAQANAAPAPSDDDSGDVDIEVTGEEDLSQDGPSNGANGASTKTKNKKKRRRKK
jgi:hypothetical protein